MEYRKWEYSVETSPEGLSEGKLRSLGNDGWELVSEVVWEDIKAREGRVVRSVFKRPRT